MKVRVSIKGFISSNRSMVNTDVDELKISCLEVE